MTMGRKSKRRNDATFDKPLGENMRKGWSGKEGGEREEAEGKEEVAEREGRGRKRRQKKRNEAEADETGNGEERERRRRRNRAVNER